jgi:PAS domain S-box-containing protein
MADTADLNPPTPRPRPLRRRRGILGALLALIVTAGVGLAAGGAILAWDLQDEGLIWLSLAADAAVVILALEIAVRAGRRRKPESDLLDLSADQDDEASGAPFASLTVDQEGTILTWNEGAERLTGYSAEQSIGNTFSFLLTPVTADIGLQTQLLRTALQAERASTECWLVNAAGERQWTHLSLAPVAGEGQWARRFLLVLRDINESASGHQALRAHELSLEQIFDAATDAIITIDEEQRIVMFNAAAERVFKCERQRALGQPLDLFIPERFRLAHRCHVDEFGATGTTQRHMGDQTTLLGLRQDGTEFPIEASISQARLRGRRLYTVILRDVSERVQAQETLQRSQQQLQQHLSALKLDVAWLAQNVPQRAKALREKLSAMDTLLAQLVGEADEGSADLRASIRDDLGFAAATEWLISEFSKRTGTACGCRVDKSVQDIGEPMASALLRALQESLSNVARHAHASRVDVQVVRENGAVQLEVWDNGTSSGDADLEQTVSSGLNRLAQRALVLGGEAKATRLESGGTRVVFRVPVNGRGSDAGVHP